MAVKTSFSEGEFVAILSQYALGSYVHAEPIPQGTIQTNFFLSTTQGKFVFRYYENRSREAVFFETHLLTYLKKHGYPCPRPYKNRRGACVGMYGAKPYVLFEFMEGHIVEEPDDLQKEQLIQKTAELQLVTRHYRPRYQQHRWNYDVPLCRALARAEAQRIGSLDAQEKLAWLEAQLSSLQLPPTMPKGICHSDFHFSNVLFQGERFAALLDFDDANYTFLPFDLVHLIESWAWKHFADSLDLEQARIVVQKYMEYRPLELVEQEHLYDLYKLSILMDCVWYFGRGAADDFYEKRKVGFLNTLGRGKFISALFSR